MAIVYTTWAITQPLNFKPRPCFPFSSSTGADGSWHISFTLHLEWLRAKNAGNKHHAFLSLSLAPFYLLFFFTNVFAHVSCLLTTSFSDSWSGYLVSLLACGRWLPSLWSLLLMLSSPYQKMAPWSHDLKLCHVIWRACPFLIKKDSLILNSV